MSIESIARDVEGYFSQVASSERDFACLYGSSVYKELGRSDVDLFVVTSKEIAVAGLIGFIKRLHEQYDRELDEEVPFVNKVRYSFDDIIDAITFEGLSVRQNKIEVPEIEKTHEFLSSREVKLRLALNALTTPHIPIGSNLIEYHRFREKAEEAVTLLGISLHGSGEFGLHDLYNSLVVGPNGEEGETFLGYKIEFPVVHDHLKAILTEATDRLKSFGIVHATGNGYVVDDENFNPVSTMRNLVESR